MKTMRYEYGSSIDDVEPTVKAYIKDDVLLYNFEFIWLIQM